MAKNGKINKTTFTDQTNIQNGTSIKSKYIHVKELRAAVVKLESYAKNVVNCGCEACQDTCICQSDKCQTCQKCQNSCTCQSCQSDKCQSCQSCQNSCTCQSCQVSNCNCNCSNCSNCDCDCGDDYSSSDGW